jgi:nucleoside-diphosphate-sugar epimerase
LSEKILLTGATGFIGSGLFDVLIKKTEYEVRVSLRKNCLDMRFDSISKVIGEINSKTKWSNTLQGIDIVIHTAGLAHVSKKESLKHLYGFQEINVAGTMNLARQAVDAGVRRFVFISSIGVNGNKNTQPFTETDSPDPVEPYAISKLEAENSLYALSQDSGMEVVIIRPPLVYGPTAPGNFRKLLLVVDNSLPLPFGCIQNKRSYIFLDNLIDFIFTCIDHPAAANQIFLVSDGQDLSTTMLIRLLRKALGRPVRLIPVPVFILKMFFKIIGKSGVAQKLCDSLQIDYSKARHMLNWSPPIMNEDAIVKTVQEYLREKNEICL